MPSTQGTLHMPYPAQIIVKFEIDGKQHKFAGTLSEPIKRLGTEPVALSYNDPAQLKDAEGFTVEFREDGFAITTQNGVNIQGTAVSAEAGKVIAGSAKWEIDF